MKASGWDKRFWASTRGRLILLMRRGSRTVNELAAVLGLTENAVRTQLDRLERDGLVHPSGTRPGTRKPNITYDLTPGAEVAVVATFDGANYTAQTLKVTRVASSEKSDKPDDADKEKKDPR